jgi:hypothetical protein
MFDFINLGLFPSPFSYIGQAFIDLIDLFEGPTLCSVDSL